MSEAPRVELNNTHLDVDLAASTSTQPLLNSAIKTKDSIVESEVGVAAASDTHGCRDPS